jgi:parallel beta-helix repeat protein
LAAGYKDKININFIAITLLFFLVNTIFILGEEGLATNPEIPGITSGSGSYFEVKNGDYLNISLNSSQNVEITLESIPEMVTMYIRSGSGAMSTDIFLTGFMPLTTYYKYEDDYHNLVEFTTDENGNYDYIQDLSNPHLVFIQPRPSTKFISDDATGGDCDYIGSWDSATKTCTLGMDVHGTIQIDGDLITLDGNGYSLKGSMTGHGVYIPGMSGVTVKNLNVENFYKGIMIFYSDNDNIKDSAFNSNQKSGIELLGSGNNNIVGNEVSGNIYGIRLAFESNYNGIENNTVVDNSVFGIKLEFSSNSNTIWGNSVESNNYGIHIANCDSNKIYNNNFIDNTVQAYNSGFNNFNLGKPEGGNHWNDWTSPNDDGDWFVDEPYTFSEGQDNLPLVCPIGMYGPDEAPPVTTAELSGTQGDNGWYISDVVVTLNAVDIEGMCGGGGIVVLTEYSLDGATWTEYTGPFEITTEGLNIVYYRSTDDSGNVETASHEIVRIDKTPPVISGSPATDPNENGWYNKDVVVEFTASDEESGIDTVTQPVTILSEGTSQSVNGTATDKAGNSATATVSDINIDKTPPTITVTSPVDYELYALDMSLDFSAEDALSGVSDALGELTNTFGEFQEVESGFTPEPGVYYIVVSATDKAGNVAVSETIFFIVYDPE